MKTLILIFATALTTLGTGCKIGHYEAYSKTVIAIDTLFSENPQAPGTYLSHNDTIIIKVSEVFKYRGGNGKVVYKIINKK